MGKTTVTQLFTELQTWPHAGVDTEDIKLSKKLGEVTVPKNLLNDWQNGVYDEDPSYLVQELRNYLEEFPF